MMSVTESTQSGRRAILNAMIRVETVGGEKDFVNKFGPGGGEGEERRDVLCIRPRTPSSYDRSLEYALYLNQAGRNIVDTVLRARDVRAVIDADCGEPEEYVQFYTEPDRLQREWEGLHEKVAVVRENVKEREVVEEADGSCCFVFKKFGRMVRSWLRNKFEKMCG